MQKLHYAKIVVCKNCIMQKLHYAKNYIFSIKNPYKAPARPHIHSPISTCSNVTIAKQFLR